MDATVRGGDSSLDKDRAISTMTSPLTFVSDTRSSAHFAYHDWSRRRPYRLRQQERGAVARRSVQPDEAPGVPWTAWYFLWGGFIRSRLSGFPGRSALGRLLRHDVANTRTRVSTPSALHADGVRVQRVLTSTKIRYCVPAPRRDHFDEDEGSPVIPFYLQSKLGRNDDPPRFSAVSLLRQPGDHPLGEHRWYASSVLDMAIFADAGK